MKWTIGKGISPFIRSGGGTSWSSYWPHQSEVLFFGLYSEISGGQMPNKVTGATDFLTVAGVAGSETYQCPNTAPYQTADTDYIWFKTDVSQRTTTTAELIGYDFTRTIVKYANTAPYAIEAIMILSSDVDTAKMRDDFDLSVWWDNTLSAHGNVKGNRGVGQNVWTGYEIESSALFARMVTAAETPTDARKIIIDTAIYALKTNSLWTKLDGLWLMAAHGVESSCLNWISSSYNLTRVGTPTFNADRGFTGNGSTMYLKTGINPRLGGFKYIQDSAMLAVYSRTSGQISGSASAQIQTNGNTTIYPRYTDDKAYYRVNGGAELSTANTDGTGLYTIVRDSATTIKYYKDKTKTDKSSNSDALPPEIVILASNNSGTITATTGAKQVSLFALGEKLSPTEQGLFYDIMVDGYLQSVGAKL